jgi:hypothetical protein
MMRRLISIAFLLSVLPLPADEPLWALAPVVDPLLPEISHKSWPTRPLDHFILTKIEAAGQKPTPAADRRSLVRRAYFDLHGLPPTTEEVEAFIRDNRPDAWSRLIDALLASPRYGERWGRHWLDIARYADSNGMDEDIAHPEAWRYRDYVIAAFNEDKPFDRFITEQLAGDLLPAENPAQKQVQLTGLGFLSVGPKMLACDDPDKMRRDIVDEQIDTTGRAFLGITFGCARCHDHKFDPVSIDDYYGLAGIFMSTRTLTKYSVVAELHEHNLTEPAIQERHTKIEELRKKKDDKGTPEEEKTKLEAEIAEQQRDLPPLLKVMGVAESPTENSPVHLRGNYQTLGEVVPRRIPIALVGENPPAMPTDHSGRLELAGWIGSPNNPLTSRVIANRIWRWHFGRGIVATPDNFGKLGVPPTHPELLDHLATKLVASGWSLKALHREIMLSATYQQSAGVDDNLKQTDPENKLFARWQPRRVEAEVLRDSILMKSGRLDLTMGGSLLQVRSNQYVDRDKLSEYEKNPRRTVYLPVLRSSGYDGQNAFDFPDPAMIEGDRRTSTVAPQALYLMNSPLVHESSAALAALLLRSTADATAGDRSAWLIRHLFGRDATAAERRRSEAFLTGFSSEKEADAWAAMARVLFATNEFLYIE